MLLDGSLVSPFSFSWGEKVSEASVNRIPFISILILALLILTPSLLLAAEPAKGIMVWRLERKAGVSADAIDSISGYITSEVERLSGQKIISEADIRTILQGEETRQKCGVTDTTCQVEIGAALGVPEVVSGDLGRLGDFWMLNLRRINVRKADALKRVSRKIRGDINALIEALPGAMAELFDHVEPVPAPVVAKIAKPKTEAPKISGKLNVTTEPIGAEVRLNGKEKGKTPYRDEAAAGKHRLELRLEGYKTIKQPVDIVPMESTTLSLTFTRAYPMNPYKKYGYVSFFTGLGVAAFGGIATWQAAVTGDKVNSGNWGADSKSKAWMGTAITSYLLGGAGMITGVVLWALSPGDQKWWESHNVSVAPAADGRGAAISLGGRW